MFGATLITAIIPGVTVGHIGDHLVLHEFFNASNAVGFTSVVVTTKDLTVPARRQRGLAAAIDGAATFEVEGPHDSIVSRAGAYVPVLLDAVARSAER